MNTVTNTQPLEYFFNLFREELFDVLIIETNILEGKTSNVTFEVALAWKPISHKDFYFLSRFSHISHIFITGK